MHFAYQYSFDFYYSFSLNLTAVRICSLRPLLLQGKNVTSINLFSVYHCLNERGMTVDLNISMIKGRFYNRIIINDVMPEGGRGGSGQHDQQC